MRLSRAWPASLAILGLLVVGMPRPVTAQVRTVSGTVTDAQSGAPIAGAQVVIRDTGIGTVTNDQGRYRLTSVPEGRIEIRVVNLGYSPRSETVEVAAGQALTVDFAMAVTAIELEGLVATGYAQQTRREVTSAISTVGAGDLQNPVLASLDGALLGKVPGVQVIQNAGNPGNGITVRVRGSASISASNQPLYVVDGMPIFREDFGQLGLGGQDLSAITGLNPDDIESIDILKDAAAAAIYGSRGSNGVVMITTKRGAITAEEGGTGSPQFQINTSVGTQEAAKRLDLMNTSEWIEYFSEAMRFDGYTEADIEDELGFLGVDPSIDTNWQDAVMRSAPVSNTQLVMAGGTSRFRYLMSGSYFDQDGIIVGSSYDRASGRVNLDFQANSRFHVTSSLAIMQEENNRIESDNSIESAVTNAIANEPWAPIFTDDGGYAGVASYANPLGLGVLNEVEARTFRAFGNVTGRVEVLPWLHATARVGFDMLNLREYEYQSPEVPLTYSSGVDGVAQIGNSNGRKYLLESFATGERFVGAHDISVTAGASVETNDRELSFVRGEGFTSPDLHWPTNAARVSAYDGTMWENNLVSWFGRANYVYDNRYILNASMRSDGSSRFGPENKYGVFPAVSAAWIVSNESFMDDVELFSDLKLRASWGKTGNESIGDFQYLGLFGTSNYSEVPGTAPSNLANPDLKWETTREWNVGVDASFLSDRLGLVGEVYNKATDDLLLNRPVTATSGFTSVLANVGGIENRGWEVSLRTVNFLAGQAGGLEWTSEMSLTHNVNEVTKLYSADPSQPGEPFLAGFYNRVEEGEPLGAFYLYRYEGVDPATGDALFSDLDADGNRVGTTKDPSSDDRMIVGSPHPDYFGGLRNTVRWGGFDLTAFMEFSWGAEIVNAMREFADDGGYFYDNKFRDALDDYWTPDNQDASQPRPSYFGTSGARYSSSRWMEDASYIRLGEVTLGYRLPARMAGMLRASEARFYVSGKNLHTWTDYSGYAPDLNSFGSGGASAALGTDFYAYPLARTLSIGFQGSW
ncbi:MAG TPA: TonB-dependent receptor [Longimicrobiales bacterium]